MMTDPKLWLEHEGVIYSKKGFVALCILQENIFVSYERHK